MDDDAELTSEGLVLATDRKPDLAKHGLESAVHDGSAKFIEVENLIS